MLLKAFVCSQVLCKFFYDIVHGIAKTTIRSQLGRNIGLLLAQVHMITSERECHNFKDRWSLRISSSCSSQHHLAASTWHQLGISSLVDQASNFASRQVRFIALLKPAIGREAQWRCRESCFPSVILFKHSVPFSKTLQNLFFLSSFHFSNGFSFVFTLSVCSISAEKTESCRIMLAKILSNVGEVAMGIGALGNPKGAIKTCIYKSMVNLYKSVSSFQEPPTCRISGTLWKLGRSLKVLIWKAGRLLM